MSQFEPLSERPIGGSTPEDVLRHGITEAVLDDEVALFDVLPGVGKSRSIPKIAALDIPLSTFTNFHENYNQLQRWGHEDGVRVEKFPVATKDCPTLDGDYPDDEAANAARDAYFDQGWPVSAIHREFDLPCEHSGPCPYKEKTKSLDTDGPGMLVGHYTQANNPAYTDGRVVVIDEGCFDSFVQEVRNPRQKAQEFIDTLDDFPFDEVRRPSIGEEEQRESALDMLEEIGLDPADHCDSVGEFHVKAPLLAYTIYGADPMENGIYAANLAGDRTATFTDSPEEPISLIRLFDPPNFSIAEAVIALDATPCVSEWKKLLGDELKHYRLFDEEGRNRYLRERGYEFRQLNSYVWPANGGNLSLTKCEAYLREIGREHDQRPDLVTSKEIRAGLNDHDLGHLWCDNLHYGDLRGKNDFADSELLVVLGSPSRGDDYYEHLAALHGECAQRVEGTEGAELSYGSDVADDILETVRRGGVFQAAMRAGRIEDTEATIYIATGMVPDWLEMQKVGRERPGGTFDACNRLRSDGMKQVVEALRGAEGMSASDLAEQVDLSRDRAKKLRQVLQERGLIEKQGERRWARYYDNGLEDLNIAGDVDLGLSVCSPLDNSIWGGTPIERLPEPQRDPVDPRDKYPDWMLAVQHRARQRRKTELLKQAGRKRA